MLMMVVVGVELNYIELNDFFHAIALTSSNAQDLCPKNPPKGLGYGLCGLYHGT